MCLLVTFIGADGTIALAANRDERYDRPSSGPFVWDCRPAIIAGRDELAGGTWLAVNACGVAAAVTNRPTVGGDNSGRPSRGELPVIACGCRSAADAREALEQRLGVTGYNGFNLFVADADEAFVIQAAGGDFSVSPVSPGWHVVGNTSWNDSADPRVVRARELLDEEGAPDLDRPRGVERLMRICRDHSPLPGGGSLCLHGRDSGTVGSSIVIFGPDRRLMRHLHADGPPCRAGYRDLTGLWGDVVQRGDG